MNERYTITNKEGAGSASFKEKCKKLFGVDETGSPKLKPTKRQYSKYRNEKGSLFKAEQERMHEEQQGRAQSQVK